MTIREIIYNLRNQLKDVKSDDIKLSDRQIEFMVNYVREKLIVQQLQKGRSISSNIKQDLGQVALTKVDSADGTIIVNKNILRTLNKVPQPIELDQKDLFTYVGGLDKLSPMAFKSKGEAIWNYHNKYASKTPLAYFSNGYIYITNCANPSLKWINIEGVFLNPRDVHKFKYPNGNPCYNPDVDNYPISGRMLDMVNEIIKKQELNLFFQLQEDSTNDASDKS